MTITAWTVAGLGALGYVVGGIPTGWLAVRWRRDLDLRGVGTGNIGTSNIYRNAGSRLAALIGPLQFAQGLLPVLTARALGAPEWLGALTGVCAVIGNGWPLYLGLRGGRGIAVATGVVAGLGLGPLAVLLAFYLAGFLLHRIALGVLVGMVALPLAGYLSDGAGVAAAGLAILAVIVARRLEGVLEDLRGQPGRRREILAGRMLHDRRPGQRLVGPNPGEGAHQVS